MVEGDPVAYVKELQQHGEGVNAVNGGIATIRSPSLTRVNRCPDP